MTHCDKRMRLQKAIQTLGLQEDTPLDLIAREAKLSNYACGRLLSEWKAIGKLEHDRLQKMVEGHQVSISLWRKTT